MIDMTADFDGLAFQFIADTAEVIVQFCLVGRMNEGCPLFGAKYQMNVILN
jgi:hypothetical protein